MPPALVKRLRDATGAGVMDCRAALAHANGDVDKALAWLKERSKAVAAGKAARETAAGVVGVATDADATSVAVVVVKSETDFVARNEQFQEAVRGIAKKKLAGAEVSSADVLDIAGKVRENVVLGSTALVSVAKTPKRGEAVAAYVHGKLSDGVGSLVAAVAVENAKDNATARDVAAKLALHVASANPKFLSREQVPADVRQAEEAKVAADPAVASKPPNVRENVVKGKMNKFFAEICLLDQSFVLGDLEGKPVKEILKDGVRVKDFVRVRVAGDE